MLYIHMYNVPIRVNKTISIEEQPWAPGTDTEFVKKI